MGQVLFSSMTLFPLGCVGVRSAPQCKFGPPHISKTVRLESGNSTHIQRGQAHFSKMKSFPSGEVWGRSAPSVNLGPPLISETIGARKFRFYTLLDKAKCSFRYDNFSARCRVGGAQCPLVKIWDPSYTGSYQSYKVGILHTFYYVQVYFTEMKIIPLVHGRACKFVNLGPSYFGNYQSQKVEILHTFREAQFHFSEMNFSARGHAGGAHRPQCKFGTPVISRKLLELES